MSKIRLHRTSFMSIFICCFPYIAPNICFHRWRFTNKGRRRRVAICAPLEACASTCASSTLWSRSDASLVHWDGTSPMSCWDTTGWIERDVLRCWWWGENEDGVFALCVFSETSGDFMELFDISKDEFGEVPMVWINGCTTLHEANKDNKPVISPQVIRVYSNPW